MFELTQQQLAELTGKGARQIRNWRGLTVRSEGTRKWYRGREAIAFWHARELAKELAEELAGMKASRSQDFRLRKLVAQTRLIELDVLEREGELIHIQLHRDVLSLVSTRARDCILALPIRAVDVLGLNSIAEAQEALRQISEAQLRNLKETLVDKLEAESQA